MSAENLDLSNSLAKKILSHHIQTGHVSWVVSNGTRSLNQARTRASAARGRKFMCF
jgi:hypothetical protein